MMRAGLLVILMAAIGCASTPAQPTSAVSTPPARAFDRQAPPRIDTETFALELTAPASTSPGEPVPITIALEGRGGHHVNLEYPLRIELGAGHGASLDKGALAATDAAELNEERARFETRARWSAAGRQWLAARVQFAVCTPDTCVPRDEALAIYIDVR